MNHVKIFKGLPTRDAPSKVVQQWNKTFPPDQRGLVEIKNPTRLSIKPVPHDLVLCPCCVLSVHVVLIIMSVCPLTRFLASYWLVRILFLRVLNRFMSWRICIIVSFSQRSTKAMSRRAPLSCTFPTREAGGTGGGDVFGKWASLVCWKSIVWGCRPARGTNVYCSLLAGTLISASGCPQVRGSFLEPNWLSRGFYLTDRKKAPQW